MIETSHADRAHEHAAEGMTSAGHGGRDHHELPTSVLIAA